MQLTRCKKVFNAASQNQPMAVPTVYDANTNSDTLDITNGSELHDSIFFNNTIRALELINMGADLNATNLEGNSPLEYAIWKNNVDVVALLLKKGARVDTTRVSGETPLLQAIFTPNQKDLTCKQDDFNRNTKIIQYLIDFKADLNIANKAHETPLFQAVNHRNTDIVKMLCAADANIASKASKNPLFQAIPLLNADIVKILCDARADLNAPNKDGSTPLAYASKLERRDIVKIHRDNGAKYPHEK
jgi:ankyrin repeat protein